MAVTPPPPLSAPWDLKPISSATAGGETLPDGRKRYWVKRSALKGVTPPILVWWFSHPEGDVDIEGRLLNRYRVWHPAITSRRGMIDENCLIIPGSHRQVGDLLAVPPGQISFADDSAGNVP
jgi:hypothetical protein